MLDHITTSAIDFASAHRLVEVAIHEGGRQGVRVVATVADPGMVVVALGKADGATPHSLETSRRKAATSASTRRPTGWMSASLAIEIPAATGALLTNVLGGVPIFVDGEHLGGLGIAGGTPDQDAAIAADVLRLAGADPIG